MPNALPPLDSLRVALVHDWLVTLRGGERVLDALCELFPQAVVHTLVRIPGVGTPRIEAMRHVSSFADRLPGAHRRHRWLLPLYPAAVELFDLSDFDLVISSSHCAAKAAIAGPGAVHVCYCHTPMRYAWDRTADYIRGSHPLLRLAQPAVQQAAGWLRQWDLATVPRVDAFVANSHNTASKIKQFYHRPAEVVAPPVECVRFAGPDPTGQYDLVLGGLVPYKRVDLALQAYAAMPDKPLVVVGDGPERERLQRMATANVRFIGRVAEAELANWYQGARLFIFAGEEDFGIVPLEAQAAGVPVVAFGQGGALESVVADKTGVFFAEPTAQSLVQAVAAAENLLAAGGLTAETCRNHAALFDRPAFLAHMSAAVQRARVLAAQRNHGAQEVRFA